MAYSAPDIEAIFEKHFQKKASSHTQVKHGVMTFKFEVALGERLYMLRVYPQPRSHVAKNEFDILTRTNAAACKTPRVCCTGQHNGYHYIIYEKIAGRMLVFSELTADAKQKIVEQIVGNLFSLSQIKHENYRNLTEEEPSYHSWRELLSTNIEAGLGYLHKSRLLGPDYCNRIEKFMTAGIKFIPEPKPGFAWSDFSQDNIIVYGGELLGFIDFEGSFAGDPALSLGYLFAVEGESEFFKAVFNEFNKFQKADMQRVLFYTFFRLLRIIKYKQDTMPTGEERKSFPDYFKGIDAGLEMIS